MKNLFIASAIILLASCAASRKAPKPPVATNTANTQEVTTGNTTPKPITAEMVAAKINHIDYNTFSGKMDVDYAGGGKSYNLDAKVAMKKGELIWLSVTGPMSIEVARGIITKDSVKILNKLQKEYIATSIDYLQDKLGLPLDLNTLQDLLIGNALFVDSKNNVLVKSDATTVQLSSNTKFFNNIIDLMLPGFLPAKSTLKDADAAKNRNAVLTYSDYKQQAGFSFPEKRNISVAYKKNIEIGLNYKSYEFNQEINTPFSIPSSYKKSL